MKGYVYKIIHRNDSTVLPYIGSTTSKLSQRMSGHRSGYRGWKKGVGNKCATYDYFDQYGIENFIIIEIARYEVEDRQKLRQYEQDWITKTECSNMSNSYGINPYKAFQTKKKCYATDKQKNYFREYKKSEKYKQQQKQVRKNKEPILCDKCDKYVNYMSWYDHKRSQKHQMNETLYYFSILPFKEF